MIAWGRILEKNYHDIRGRKLGLVFQNAQGSLNPFWSIKSHFIQILSNQKSMRRKDTVNEAVKWLNDVHIPKPQMIINAYPFELSGGMAQRIAIALALASRPLILIADELTTGIDVTLQMEILALLEEVKEEHNLSMIIIAHDIDMLAHIVDRIAVFFNGEIVEEGDKEVILEGNGSFRHPYTAELIASIPNIASVSKLEKLPVSNCLLSEDSDYKGCSYYNRCRFKQDICKYEEPSAFTVGHSHFIKCWLYKNAG